MIRLLILSLLPIASAFAHDVDGKWTGSGTWDRAQGSGPIATQTSVTIQLTESEFHMAECFQFINPEGRQDHQCLDSQYQIKDEVIYNEGRKIGDVFPWGVVIFQGNSQVSEQMIVRLVGEDQIQFRYNFATYDGESDNRLALLKKSP